MDKNIFSSIENTPLSSIIEQVYKGMSVIDQEGESLGKVEVVKMGDTEAITTQGEELEGEGLVQIVSTAIFGPNIPLPKSIRDKLLRSGYIQIDSSHLLEKDLFVAADKIASVSNGIVTLSVSKNQIT